MNKHKVAIITRTKNRCILLKRAIESVIGQTFNDWFLVIVNDGGEKEDIDNLIKEYNHQLKEKCLVIHNEESRGMEAASNIGIKSSNSEYIVIHDDDDSWHPLFLEKCVDFLDNNPYPKINGVITYSIRIIERLEENRIIIEHKEPFNSWMKSVSFFRMASSNTFPPISFVYNRSVIDEIGYYNESLPVLGDWEFNLRFLTKYDIFLIPDELAYYHHRVSLKTGQYSNSVIGNNDKHIFYDTSIRNELLRKDLECNNLGIGYVVNIAKSFDQVHGQLYHIEQLASQCNRNIEQLASQCNRNSLVKRIIKKFL